jgi:glucose uptake protein GlcU
VNALRAKPLFLFTWWAVAGAALWVPAGFLTISAVSLCGVATTSVMTNAVSSILNFVVDLIMDKTMKTHGSIPLAPFYLVAIVLGMAGLILSPRASCGEKAEGAVKLNSNAPTASTMSMSMGLDPQASVLLQEETTKPDSSRKEFVIGVLMAMTSGFMSSMKFTVHHVGQKLEAGSDTVEAEFGVFSSYMISFGVGCAISTPIYVAIFAVWQKGIQHKEMPSLEFPVMKIYGMLAGVVWFVAYMCQQAANDLGGQGVMGPATSACSLIVSGLWGILYFREIKKPMQIACWVLAAVWTMTFVILNSKELVDKPADMPEVPAFF